ncbi:MAG: hypothetical protein GY822_09425 [Deltaproteobacteria bacterium]|nr:hypothetical protein [Deltaproteobacteria bacterium]
MSDVVIACPDCLREHVFVDFVPFRDECEGCSADLHVCKACRFYDRYASDECRESSAEAISVKDRSNLCEFFKPKAQSADEDEASNTSKDPLASLFGGGGTAKKEAADPLADLFKKKN